METSTTSTFDASRYIGFLWKKRLIIIACICGAIAAAVLFSFGNQSTYEVTASMRIGTIDSDSIENIQTLMERISDAHPELDLSNGDSSSIITISGHTRHPESLKEEIGGVMREIATHHADIFDDYKSYLLQRRITLEKTQQLLTARMQRPSSDDFRDIVSLSQFTQVNEQLHDTVRELSRIEPTTVLAVPKSRSALSANIALAGVLGLLAGILIAMLSQRNYL